MLGGAEAEMMVGGAKGSFLARMGCGGDDFALVWLDGVEMQISKLHFSPVGVLVFYDGSLAAPALALRYADIAPA